MDHATFWLHFDYILTTFWLHSEYILTTFWHAAINVQRTWIMPLESTCNRRGELEYKTRDGYFQTRNVTAKEQLWKPSGNWLNFILKDFIPLLKFFYLCFCFWFVGGVSSGGIVGDCERNDVCVLNAAGDHFEEERGLFSGSQFWTRSEFCQRADEGGTHNNANPKTNHIYRGTIAPSPTFILT